MPCFIGVDNLKFRGATVSYSSRGESNILVEEKATLTNILYCFGDQIFESECFGQPHFLFLTIFA